MAEFLANCLHGLEALGPGGLWAVMGALFLPFLRRQVALIRPKRLVLVGGVAAKGLIGGKEGITRLRGRWHEVEIAGLGRIPALPTLHPAYLLRSPASKREAWADLLLLRRTLDQASA